MSRRRLVRTERKVCTCCHVVADSAYLDNRSYEVLQVTAWIPLLDATRENGCMEVAARGHLKGKVATHQCCWGGTWYVMLEEQEMEDTLGER